jgi:hypothetical protein
LANPPRTWFSAAWAYCLQNPGSAAWAVVNPARKNIDKITLDASLLAMPLLHNPWIPRGKCCIAQARFGKPAGGLAPPKPMRRAQLTSLAVLQARGTLKCHVGPIAFDVRKLERERLVLEILARPGAFPFCRIDLAKFDPGENRLSGECSGAGAVFSCQ